MTNEDGSRTGAKFEELIERRMDESFSGCRLNDDEAKAVLALVRASRAVFAGLNARIAAADGGAVPVFDGIADLNDALRAFEPEEVGS